MFNFGEQQKTTGHTDTKLQILVIIVDGHIDEEKGLRRGRGEEEDLALDTRNSIGDNRALGSSVEMSRGRERQVNLVLVSHVLGQGHYSARKRDC